MQCCNCGNEFPTKIIVDGKARNLQNRKFCLVCSPFGCHNTRSLYEFQQKKDVKVRKCDSCGKDIIRKNEKGKLCWVCANKSSRQKKIGLIKTLVGDSCWFCGYDKCWQAMDFHHVDPTTKSFEITTRELQFAWDRILAELKKCVLTCCRCHREIHAGLIPTSKVMSFWEDKWGRLVA